ncbi:MAG: DNA polymerase III subunit chi [Rhodocyclaceae bacterium]|nr:DNA polymerase III subunit chi [Rhodocyclaceae bacterium]
MATEIHFYHNTPDRIAAACRIAARALAGGRRLAVRIPDDTQRRRFDHLLWTFEPGSFVPHVAVESPLAGETSIVFGGKDSAWPHDDVLLNLGDDLPGEFERFAMLLEVVSTDEDARQAARSRWKHYRGCGIEPMPHDLGSRGES